MMNPATNDEEHAIQTPNWSNLPLELLGQIFSQLSGKDRKFVRRVCKSWYEECCQLPVCIKTTGIDHFLHMAEYFTNNTRLKCLIINFTYFGDYELSRIPETVWKNIGARIHSLEINQLCTSGDIGIRNMILHCNNLRVFRMILGRTNLRFCSPETLEELDIVQRKLKIFNLNINMMEPLQNYIRYNDHYCLVDCERIFRALTRIYPNLTDFEVCKIGFTREPTEIYEPLLPKSLAFALFSSGAPSLINREKPMEVLQTLSWLRLKTLKLDLGNTYFRPQDELELLEFLSRQPLLESIQIYLNSTKLDLLISSFLLIIDNCPRLHKIEYRHTGPSWLPKLTAAEMLRLSQLEYLNTNEVTRSPLSLTLCVENDWLCINEFLSLHTHILYMKLDIEFASWPDVVLQSVFQHMTNLKTLEIKLGRNFTEFGFTGCRQTASGIISTIPGYSIRRLRNLQSLRIELCPKTVHVNDDIFFEFNFPKLERLECMVPRDPEVLATLGKRLPLLRELVFDPALGLNKKSLEECCRLLPNLRTVRLYDNQLYYTQNVLSKLSRDVVFTIFPTPQNSKSSKPPYLDLVNLL